MFGAIFAESIAGTHLARPLGIADVVKGKAAWSLKTVTAKLPHNTKQVRLISGRNSPDYSAGLSDPREDATVTGRIVLSIWNARVNEALAQYNDLRILVLVRNLPPRQFLLFEEAASRYTYSDFKWAFNSRGNLEGSDLVTGKHRFTWQPHGSQFTVLRSVPAHARRFSINRPVPLLEVEQVLRQVAFDEEWVSIEPS